MHRSTIYTIAILIAGIFILAFAVPDMVKQLYAWYTYVDLRKSYAIRQPHDFSGLFIATTEVLIGLLFLGNQKTFVNFIELKRREARYGWTKDSNV